MTVIIQKYPDEFQTVGRKSWNILHEVTNIFSITENFRNIWGTDNQLSAHKLNEYIHVMRTFQIIVA